MKELDFLKSKLEERGALDENSVQAIESIDRRLLLFQKLEESLYNSELYLVYMHTTPDGRKYIGITRNLPTVRWNEGAGYESQRKFYKAIQAYGWLNIEHRIIAAGLTEIEAKTLETELILKHKTYETQYGYNTNLSIAEIKKAESAITGNKTKDKTKEEVDKKQVAVQLIEKYSIKTVGGHIYYSKDGEYIKESEQPIIGKELLLTFNLPPKKHKEIIDIIKIISFANKEEVFPDNSIHLSMDDPIKNFVLSLAFNIDNDFFVSYDDAYNSYIMQSDRYSAEPLEQRSFLRAVSSEIQRLRPELIRIESEQKRGWGMRLVVESRNGFMQLTDKGIAEINAWLEATTERCICVSMIWDEVFHNPDKCPKSISNEIGEVVRKSGWRKGESPKRFAKYGMQRYFI